MPDRIGELEFDKGYAAYLCADKPQVIQGDPFNWEQMVTLYQQLDVMAQKATQAQIAILNDLIRWQATL